VNRPPHGHVDGRRHKVLGVLRRRGPLAVLLLLAAIALAWVAGSSSAERYSAETVMIVPAVSAGRLPPGDPDGANKLAKTYAVAIPLSGPLLAGTAAKMRISRAELEKNLSVTNDAGTSLVRMSYEGSQPQQTVRLLASMTGALVGTNPPVPVSPGTLKLVSAPDAVTRTAGGPASAVPLGVVLGLLLAAGATAVLERSVRHLDRPSELVRELEVPVTTWADPTPASVSRLARHWFPSSEGGGAGVVALVGCGRLAPARLQAVAGTLRRLLRGEVRVVPAATPGEGVDEADVVVLVVPQGAAWTSVEKVAAAVQAEGRTVSWALFLPRSNAADGVADAAEVEGPAPRTPLEQG
jgi:capsular polysaccharide biosynthesis protein